jgi:hypothetical protein
MADAPFFRHATGRLPRISQPHKRKVQLAVGVEFPRAPAARHRRHCLSRGIQHVPRLTLQAVKSTSRNSRCVKLLRLNGSLLQRRTSRRRWFGLRDFLGCVIRDEVRLAIVALKLNWPFTMALLHASSSRHNSGRSLSPVPHAAAGVLAPKSCMTRPSPRPVTYRGVARRGQNDWNTVDATIRLVNLDRLNPRPVLTAA